MLLTIMSYIHTGSVNPIKRVVICLALCLVTLLAGCQPTWPDSRPFQARQTEYPDILSASIIDTKEYMVQERLTITNLGPGEPSKQNLWIALIGDVYPYQKVAKRVITPEGYRVVTDEYGNQIAEYDFSEMSPGSEIQVKMSSRTTPKS